MRKKKVTFAEEKSNQNSGKIKSKKGKIMQPRGTVDSYQEVFETWGKGRGAGSNRGKGPEQAGRKKKNGRLFPNVSKKKGESVVISLNGGGQKGERKNLA